MTLSSQHPPSGLRAHTLDIIPGIRCADSLGLGTHTFIQPHNTRWLTPAQRRLAQLRLAEDTGEADEDSASDSYVHAPEPSSITAALTSSPSCPYLPYIPGLPV